MSGTEGGGPLTILALLIAGVAGSASASRMRGAERRARHEAARAEAEARAQRQKWFELMQRQMARGSAGDATPDEAVEALRGSGGRGSKLDEEFF